METKIKTGIYSVIVVEKGHSDFMNKRKIGVPNKDKCFECFVDDIEYIELRNDLNKTESGVIYSKHEMTVKELQKMLEYLTE